ncbi:MAG: hypothetical protein QXQ90_08705 [Desulfurococcaceae archaeon]
MVKLEIHIPPAQAELCTVHARRLPTKTGFTEVVCRGLHRPDDAVVVRELCTAIVSETRIKEEYKIEYYEPVEYFVVVSCRSKEGCSGTGGYTRSTQVA